MASFPSLFADELGVSDDQARTLLTAMLREVHKQARKDRVHLPRLGTFRMDDGRLTFDPADGLARAVNEEYEGLEAEDLPGTSPESAAGAVEGTDDEEDAAAETEEFQVPSEPSPSDPASSRSASQASETGAQSDPGKPDPETEEFYPLVEDDDVDASYPRQTTEEADEEHESLSSIWEETAEVLDSGSGVDWPAEAEKQSALEPSPTDPASEAPPASSPSSPDQADEETEPREQEPPAPPSDGGSSTAARVIVGGLVVLLLGGAAWYLLGQRGVVPTPRSTFAKLQARFAGAPTQTSSPSPDRSPSPSDPPTVPTGTDAPDDTASADATPDQGSDAASEAPSASDGIDPTRGGWSLVVASRSERTPAEELASTYRERFADAGLPVDVLVGQVGGTTRYRVGIGQFDSLGAAQQAIERHQDQLPEGAWPLRLQ